MTVDRTQAEQGPPQGERTTAAGMLEELKRFEGTPEKFLTGLLALQCRVGDAAAAAVFRLGSEGRPEFLAAWPPPAQGTPPPPWLAHAVELAPQVIASGKTTARALHAGDDLYGQKAKRHLVVVPLAAGGGFRGVAAFIVEQQDQALVAASCERLELTAGFAGLYETRLALQSRENDLQRLRTAMEVLAAVNSHERFMAAAMALCNEAASRWGCDRVGLGILKGRYVQLRAMNHTEQFSRKMKLVQDTEAAMEECLDQDAEVVCPADPDSTFVCRAAAELSRRHGPTAIVSLPLRAQGEVKGVLLLERPVDRPFELAEVEALRLTCELCTAHILTLHEHDRWVGAKAAHAARKCMAAAVGPKHTWKKVIALLVPAAALFLPVATDNYTVNATFVLEAVDRRVVSAPFDGELGNVLVEPDDEVVAEKTVLGKLRAEELRLELAAAKARYRAHMTQADAAMKEDKRADAQIARAQADQAGEEARLLEHKIAQATLVAPISGKVISSDLKPHVGASIKAGDPLFQIAPVENVRAELAIPEDEIAEVVGHEGELKGELSATTRPGRRFEFVVGRINPVAEVVQKQNVFKARAGLVTKEAWLRPGMTGVAKIHVGRRRYAWLWTRRLVNWLRMKLWL